MILAFASEVFNREFFGSMKSEDVVEITDTSSEAFKAMIRFIYNKKTKWQIYDLSFVSSVYYLAEKYDLETLREEIIAAISRYQVSDENVLDVAILAEEKNLHQPLSEALYNVAAIFLSQKFMGNLDEALHYFTEVNETHAFIIFNLMKHMKNLPVMFDALINDRVYMIIEQLQDEFDNSAGVDRDTIRGNLQHRYQKLEVEGALDFLAGDGHIYSTIDEDHFKTTD